MLKKITVATARRQLYEEAAEERLYGSRREAKKKEATADSSLSLPDDDELDFDDGVYNYK
jgi:hypothetical protein